MTTNRALEVEKQGWLADMIGGASKAFAFRRSVGATAATPPAAVVQSPRRRGARPDARAKSAEVHRLAGEGVSPPEIARRTALAQDTVALLLHLAPREPVESAGRGTFFRILQTRMAG